MLFRTLQNVYPVWDFLALLNPTGLRVNTRYVQRPQTRLTTG